MDIVERPQDTFPVIDRIDHLKLVAGTATAAWAVPAAVEASRSAETLIVGVPTSVLLCAMVGVLSSILILPERDAVRVTPDRNVHGHWPRAWQMTKRVGLVAAILGAYAFAAAWASELAAYILPGLAGGPQMSMAGISGLIVRRMLPRYLLLIEKATGTELKDDD